MTTPEDQVRAAVNEMIDAGMSEVDVVKVATQVVREEVQKRTDAVAAEVYGGRS